jgi:hypothetical protein
MMHLTMLAAPAPAPASGCECEVQATCPAALIYLNPSTKGHPDAVVMDLNGGSIVLRQLSHRSFAVANDGANDGFDDTGMGVGAVGVQRELT